jgi:2-C-methyl-D-erythritol 4-phosphate cytidylyltransferase
LLLGGIPVIARTLLAFERSTAIKNIVLVTRECDILPLQQLAQKYMISKVTDIIVGGNCREESVKNGINRLDKDTDYVLIHDGARPLVTTRVIDAVAQAAKEKKCVSCAVPVKDTIKVVKGGVVEQTLDRSQLVSIQTPQGFEYNLFCECINGVDNLDSYTDDCAVVEACGYSVSIVEGDYNNIKITTPEDIAVAEGILRCKGEV